MAVVTQLSPMGTPGARYTFSAKVKAVPYETFTQLKRGRVFRQSARGRVFIQEKRGRVFEQRMP